MCTGRGKGKYALLDEIHLEPAEMVTDIHGLLFEYVSQ